MKEVDQFILLRTLYESERLSRRSYSLCNLAELVTLGDLKSFYESHKDFMCFEDYDRESNEELILLSRQTFSIDELSLDRSGFEKYKALPPKQLEQLHNHLMLLLLQLPVRQYNIIARILNNKIQPEKIINLILTKEFRFDRIVNVGKVSLIRIEVYQFEVLETLERLYFESKEEVINYEELITEEPNVNHHVGYEQPVTDIHTINFKQTISYNLNNLSSFQCEVLFIKIEYLYNELDARAKRLLATVMVNNNPELIFNMLILEYTELSNIRNIGIVTKEEVIHFKNKIHKSVQYISKLNEEELKLERSKLLMNFSVLDFPHYIHSELKNQTDSNGKIKVFAFIFSLVDNRILLKDNEYIYFLYHFTKSGITENNESFEPNADNNIHLRNQFQRRMLKRINKKIYSIIDFKEANLMDYGLVYDPNLITIKANVFKSINENEGTDFNNTFFVTFYSTRYSSTHELIVRRVNVFLKKYKKPIQQFNCFFLVKNTLATCFNFGKFMDDIAINKIKSCKQTYSITLSLYIIPFFINLKNDDSIIKEVEFVCKQMLKNEFDWELNENADLIFERTSRKTIFDYCLEMLEEASVPMTNIQMRTKLLEKYPQIQMSDDAFPSTMNHRKDIFICFGRSNTFGLKKWETERDNVKGGTIREIVSKYLESNESPKHIYDIYLHVKKFRVNTTVMSVHGNLRLDKHSKLIFINIYYVGLKEKKYKQSLKTEIIKHFYFTLVTIKKYNNWFLKDVIDFYQKEYGYDRVHVEFLMHNRMNEGAYKLDEFGRIVI